MKKISLELRRGQTLALVGRSGSGKSMTALSIMGVLPENVRQTQGEIAFEGTRLDTAQGFKKFSGSEIAIIFQDAKSALNPVFRVGTQILDVVRTHRIRDKKAAAGRVIELLQQVGFAEAEKVYKLYPHQLSGGMAQRAMIAMALSCSPKLIIADEPTSSLDVLSGRSILHLISALQKKYGFALLLISHDLRIVSQLADHMLVMKDGRVIEQGHPVKVIAHPEHAYTHELTHGDLLVGNRFMHEAEDAAKINIVES